MISVESTIISQYANSPTITQLVKNIDEYIDPRTDIDQFFSYVFDVSTAQGFGLDIWGRIVGVARELSLPPVYDNFGFAEALPDSLEFDVGTFFSGITPDTDIYRLSDDAYRQLIMTKALSNISACSAAAINQLISNLFAERGRCYVNDLGSMSLRYVFEFALTPVELAIITRSGALPRPAGVLAISMQVPANTFGFAEAGGAPFDVGTFFDEGLIHAII